MYLAVSSKISFCGYDNKFGLSKASGTSTRDSSSQIARASLSFHDALPHNSEQPVTLPALVQSHSCKQFHIISVTAFMALSNAYISFTLSNIAYILFINRNSIKNNVRFEVFTAVTMKNGVFWDVTPCGCCKNRRFGGT
jgi:hypothetical protein